MRRSSYTKLPWDVRKYMRDRKKQMYRIQKLMRRYPKKDYGMAFFKRGEQPGLGMFGKPTRALSGITPEQLALRKATGYRGSGLYTGSGGYWGRKIGGWFGHADLGDKLGDLGGSAIRSLVPGGALAMDAANAAGRVMQGAGAYDEVTSNDLINTAGTGIPVPEFRPHSDGQRVVISNREYIGDIYGPDTNWSVQTYAINPGLASTFPWLSQVAQNYEEYSLVQCIFTFRSTVTDFASASGQQGTILAATQYNAADVPFPNKARMMEYDGAMSCKVSSTLQSGVECDPRKLSMGVGKYVRAGPITNEEDIKTYDHGRFNVAVTNVPATYQNQSLGELWVSYTVELRKPKFFTGAGFGIQRDVFLARGANEPGSGTLLNPFTAPGAVSFSGMRNSIGCAIRHEDATSGPQPVTTITFPATWEGNVRLQVRLDLGGVNCVPLVIGPGTGNVTPISDIPAPGGGQWWSGVDSGSSAPSLAFVDFRVGASTGGVDNTITIEWGVVYTTIVAAAVIDICELNTYFNITSDGPNDQLALVNSLGQQVAW